MGLSLAQGINAASGAINGYRSAQWAQNQEDYSEAARANAEAQMLAQQQTYQPAANAQIAQAGLSQAQAQGQASLVPQQTQVASTMLGTQQSAADAALTRQPVLNQTANNQAQAGATQAATAAAIAPTQGATAQLGALSQEQQAHLGALNGLYTAMMQGPDVTKSYIQQVADSGAFPSIAGKQIGQVGITKDGQNFVALDTQGNSIFAIPTQALKQVRQMSIPTEWHPLKPGESLASTQGGAVTGLTTAPVPAAYSNERDPAVVKTANWLAQNVTGGDTNKAYNMARQATTMSREQFVATTLPNMMTVGGMTDPTKAAATLNSVYDNMRAMSSGGAPGLSNAPGSNTSGGSTIDYLIGGANPSGTSTVSNPYAPDPSQ